MYKSKSANFYCNDNSPPEATAVGEPERQARKGLHRQQVTKGSLDVITLFARSRHLHTGAILSARFVRGLSRNRLRTSTSSARRAGEGG